MKIDFTAPDVESVKAPLDEATFLPSRYYGNENYFETEKDKILKHNWLVVGRWDQVENTGDYFTINTLGEPIVILKDHSQSVKAFSNICRHRAGPVASGSGNSALLTCPYHLWSYRLDGTLKSAPAMDRAKEFKPKECTLNEFPVIEWQGFILVNLSKNANTQQLDELDDLLAHYRLKALRRLEPIVFDCPWDWKLSAENVMEFYHYPGVHSQTVGSLFNIKSGSNTEFETMLKHTRNQYKRGKGNPLAYCVQTSKDPLTYPGLPTFDTPVELRDKQIGVYLFPNLSFIITPAFTVWPHFIIDTVNHHRIEYFLLVHPELASNSEYSQMREGLREMIKGIHEEDMPILERVAKGLKSSSHVPGRPSHLESVIWQFHT